MQDGKRKSTLFREVNERIRDVSREWDTSTPAGFFCECDDAACNEVLDLSVAEYEAIRVMNDCFVVLRGHESSACDHVVARNNGHVIVRLVAQAPAAGTTTPPAPA